MSDDFEQRLREQTLRRIPGEWRAEILNRAQATNGLRHSTLDPQPSLLLTLRDQLSALLWPHPRAWAGLAAVWLAILAMNLSTRDDRPIAQARAPLPPSPETLTILREQRQLLAELNGVATKSEADRPKSGLPQPRSERRGEMLVG